MFFNDLTKNHQTSNDNSDSDSDVPVSGIHSTPTLHRTMQMPRNSRLSTATTAMNICNKSA